MVMQAQDAGRYKSPCGRKSRRYDVVTLSRGENAKNNDTKRFGDRRAEMRVLCRR